MKKHLLKTLVVVTILLASNKIQAQYVTIPDPNFVTFLQVFYPQCMNGNMMDTTCNSVVNATNITFYPSNISDLTGIQYFDNLIYFDCGGNQITSLPSLPNSLEYLRCAYNQLTSLPTLPSSLILLDCPDNQLTSLPQLPNSLAGLDCRNNQLTSLPTLPIFLDSLFCDNNPDLHCFPKLNKIYRLSFSNTGIQCLPNIGDVTYSTPLLSTLPLCDIFNTNGCQAFWNISGKVYDDADANCIANSIEPVYSNIKLNLSHYGILEQSTYTIQNGYYSFDTDTGLFTLEVDTAMLPITVSCPANFYDTAYIANNDTMRIDKNFSLACKPGFDVGVLAITRDSGIFRPGDIASVKIYAGDMANKYGLHCAAGVSGTVQITISGLASYIGIVNGALTPTVAGNILTYTIPDFDLIDFNNDFHFQMKTDTIAQLGDSICFDVSVTPSLGDNNIANNTLTHCFTIVNSYDPNMKLVSPVNILSIYDKKLTYTIQFQNTGNAPAQHIYLKDTLDANLDVSTFELLAYSHQPQVQLIGDKLRFNFPNINLPDSTNDEPNSHGYVQYSIMLKDNLPLGTIIKNTAYIYFDFNPPIVTNTTSNIIAASIFDYTLSKNNISVYPNPTTNTITITSKTINTKGIAKLYDMLGKELKTQTLNSNNSQINLKEFTDGIYLLKVFEGSNLIGVQRVVKFND